MRIWGTWREVLAGGWYHCFTCSEIYIFDMQSRLSDCIPLNSHWVPPLTHTMCLVWSVAWCPLRIWVPHSSTHSSHTPCVMSTPLHLHSVQCTSNARTPFAFKIDGAMESEIHEKVEKIRMIWKSLLDLIYAQVVGVKRTRPMEEGAEGDCELGSA